MSVARSAYPTAAAAALARRRWITLPLALLLVLATLLGLLVLAVGAVVLPRLLAADRVPRFADDVDHFLYGSIGADRDTGIPFLVWQALPRLFPEVFGDAAAQAAARARGEGPYAVFGFLYQPASGGAGPRDLPIGISRRTVRGVDLVWFNCAVCHVGTARLEEGGERRIIAGMTSNNLDLHRFIRFVLAIADDPRLAPDPLLAAIEESGTSIGMLDRLLWRHVVAPALREGLLVQRARLAPLMALQPPWGPGRVDTFNPYKVLHFGMQAGAPPAAQWVGTADFPTVFHQRPRQGMNLHWDGNNPSLAERNLSAAAGAGLRLDGATEADHQAIERVARWLLDLAPPPSPMRAAADAEAVARGRRTYMAECAACHGYQGADGYVFEGAELGRVVPIDAIGTDRGRLDSYTDAFRVLQRDRLRLTRFVKTDGYANQPLDGLWLRAPYLHNGSVPTLDALLRPPAERPVVFLRGGDVIDRERGGFRAPIFASREECEAAARGRFCFDTRLPGNGNGGHLYGTALDERARADLVAYLRTF